MSLAKISFLDDGPASASVIADDDVEATLLPHGHIHNTLAGHPELTARLYRSLALLMAQRIRRSRQFRPNLTHAVRHPESSYAVHG